MASYQLENGWLAVIRSDMSSYELRQASCMKKVAQRQLATGCDWLVGLGKELENGSPMALS